MVSTILIVILVVMIGLSLLALIAGLIKGIYKTTVKTLIEVALIIVFLFLTPTFANAIGNIDLSNFGYSFEIMINETTHTIALTSIQQTLADIINATGLISPMNGISVYQTAIALATSLLAYVLFFVEVLVIQLFIWLFTAIIYNGIFRWFLPVESRAEAKERRSSKTKSELIGGIVDSDGTVLSEENQKKKLRRHPWIAGLLGACGEFCLTVILISPFTSLARIVIDNRDTLKSFSSLLPSSIYSNYDSYLDEIENSAIMKITGLGGLDSLIMDTASSVTINGQSVSLNGLISSTLDIAAPAISSGAISFEDGVNSITINYPILLSSETVDSVLSAIIANPMVIALIPPIIDAALTSIFSGEQVLNDLDFTNIDWSSELTIINSFYKEIYSTGVVSTFFSSDGSSLSFDNFEILTSSMTDEMISTYGEAVAKLGELEVVQKNMPVLMAGIASSLTSQGISVMPTEASAYENIDWSHDLQLLVEGVLKIARLAELDINADIVDTDFTELIFDVLENKEKRDELEVCLVGDTTDEESEGILNMELLEPFDLTQAMIVGLENIPSIQKYIAGIDLETTLAGFSISDLREEIVVYFDACDNIFSENSILVGEDFSFDDLDWGDEKVALQLYEIIDILEESQIFMTLYAPTIKTFLHNNTDLDIETYLFGLTPYDFNYDSSDFLDNFKSVILLLPSIKTMTDAFSDSSLTIAQQLEKVNTNTIRSLLNIVANSDFFNTPKATATTKNAITNANIYTLLSNLFEVDAIADLGLYAPSLSTISSIDWGNGFDGKEIDKICQVLDDAIINADFLLNGSFDLDKLTSSQAIADLISDGLDSEILSPCILQIINDSLNEYLNDLGIPVSFQEMRTSLWKEDADDIAKILDLLRGLDLEDLDFDSLDPERLNAIITILASANFTTVGNTNFGYLIYSLLDYQGFFEDLGLSSSSLYQYFVSSSFIGGTTSSTIVVQDGDGNDIYVSVQISETGEIAYFCELLSILQKNGGLDALSDGKLPTDLINALCESTVFESSLLKGLFAQLASNSINTIELGSVYQDVIESIDFTLLSSMSADEIKFELQLLSDLYDLSINDRLEQIFSSIFDLEEDLETLTSLIVRFGQSKLLTTVADGETLSPIARLVYVAIIDNGLVEHVTLQDTDSEQESVLLAILSEVSSWEDEASYFADFITYLQGFDVANLNVVTTSAEIIDKLEAALHIANQSDILHRLPSALISAGFVDYDLTEILADPSTDEVTHYLDFYVNIGTTAGEKAFWDIEINYACSIFDLVRQMFTTDDDAGFDDVVIGGDTEYSIPATILAYFGKMQLFADSRSLISYNFINNSIETLVGSEYQLSDLFMPYEMRDPAPYLEDSDGYRFEALIYSNQKLLNSDGEFDVEFGENGLAYGKGYDELVIFDKFFNELLEVFNTYFTQEEETSSVSFYDLTYVVFDYDETDGLYRSDISSELSAGVINKMLESLTSQLVSLVSSFSGSLTYPDFFEDDYFLVNPIEGKAIDGLIELIEALSDLNLDETYYLTAEQLTEIFESFSVTIEKDSIINSFLNEDEYKTTGNSLLVLSLFETLSKIIPVKETDGYLPTTLYSYLSSSTQLESLLNNTSPFANLDLNGLQ